MFTRTLVGAGLALALSGCGGGSGETSTTISQEPPSASPSLPGFYSGINRPEGSAGDIEIDLMIAPDGMTRGISQSLFMLSSQASLNQGAFSSDVLINFEPQSRGDGIFFGNAIQEGSISGSKTGNRIEGSTFFGDNQGSFSFDGQAIDAPGDVASLSGSYVDGTSTAEFSVDTDGVFSGADSFGCLYSGSIALTSADIAIYSVSVTVENCGEYSAEYIGLVTYAPVGTFENQTQDWLIFAVDNGELSMNALMVEN